MSYIAIALIVCCYIVCDTYLYSKGHDTLFFTHKTDEEKRIREANIKLLEMQVKTLERDL